MGFFSNVTRAVSGLFEEAGAAVGDVVENIGDEVLGQRGGRGQRIGTAVGGALYGPEGAAVGGTLGSALSRDVEAAPRIARERAAQRKTDDNVVADVPLERTQNMFDTTQRPRTAGFNMMRADEGTVIDIRYPKSPRQTIGEIGVDILGEVVDFFTGEDDNVPMQTGAMCPIQSMPKAFNVNQQTGCITITRKQQAKLKEAVRMFGGAAVAKNLRISQATLQQLLLKTFRARRRGISGADIRAVKRVDRQMHSLACALGGISTTSRAVASRKSPPKRSC